MPAWPVVAYHAVPPFQSQYSSSRGFRLWLVMGNGVIETMGSETLAEETPVSLVGEEVP